MISEGARMLGKALWNHRPRTGLCGNLLEGGWRYGKGLMTRTTAPADMHLHGNSL
jgi:hypothetical protein